MARMLLNSFCAASCLLLVATASAQDNATTPPRIQSIDRAMQSFVEKGETSGVVTLVAHRGKIAHLGAVGLRDNESNSPMQNSSLFSIASMTKPIVATAVMILQDEGKLNVDDKVSKYLPAFAQVKLASGSSPMREITIRDAITHTSGLAGSQVFSGSLADAVDALAQQPLAFEPGSKWQYSPGLNVAGRIVEVVSQQPLDQFLSQRIFEPLGMTSTSFFPDAKQQKRIAVLYSPGDKSADGGPALVAAENQITDYSADRGPNPSGGLVSSARDLFRFYQMVLNDGQFRKQRVLSAEAVAQMTSPQSGELVTGFTPGNCWGLGWCIVREPQDISGMLSAGTFGHGGAFGTQGWVDPKTQTIYILLIQRKGFGNSDGSEIRKVFQHVANDALGIKG